MTKDEFVRLYSHIFSDPNAIVGESDIPVSCMGTLQSVLSWMDVIRGVFPDMDFTYQGNALDGYSFNVYRILTLDFEMYGNGSNSVEITWFSCPEVEKHILDRKSFLEATCPHENYLYIVLHHANLEVLKRRWSV